MMIDRRCRIQLLSCEPDLTTLLRLCRQEEGEENSITVIERRVTSAKMLASLVQRDHEIRMHLVQSGGLMSVLEILKEHRSEQRTLSFYMAMILSTLVLDDTLMKLTHERKETCVVFDCCLTLLKELMRDVHQHERISETSSGNAAEKDAKLLVDLCDACARAIWGSSYYCAQDDSDAIGLDEIQDLAELAVIGIQTTEVRSESGRQTSESRSIGLSCLTDLAREHDAFLDGEPHDLLFKSELRSKDGR